MPEPRAVLLDIDGTLLRSAGAGARALALALADLLDLPLDDVVVAVGALDFRGATDQAVVHQLEVTLDVDLRTRHELLLQSYLGHLEQALAAVTIELLPGVLDLVATLRALPNMHVGLLTGNFREAARHKLTTIGLHALVDNPGGFGEDGYHRHELATQAATRLARHQVTASRIVVVGDTEHDIACGKHIGAQTVAVGTGWTAWDDLERAQPDLLLLDLSDAEPLIELIQRLD